MEWDELQTLLFLQYNPQVYLYSDEPTYQAHVMVGGGCNFFSLYSLLLIFNNITLRRYLWDGRSGPFKVNEKIYFYFLLIGFLLFFFSRGCD